MSHFVVDHRMFIWYNLGDTPLKGGSPLELPLSSLISSMNQRCRIPPIEEKLAAIALPHSARRGELHPVRRPKITELLVRDVREAMMPGGFSCPRCQGAEVIRYGKRKGVQRYKCKECSRYFTDLTGTPFEGLHLRDKFLEFCLCMIRGLSVRASAQAVGISKNTAFCWRHRIISKLARADAEVKLSGIVEISQRLFPVSYKGSSKFAGVETEGLPLPRSYWPMGLSRSVYHSERGALIIAVDRTGRVRAEIIVPAEGGTFGQAMYSMIEKNATVCAQREPGIWRSGNDYPEPICWIGRSRANGWVRDRNVGFSHPIYHVNHARHLMLQFRNWMRRFNGVATKYLLRYAAWFWRVLAFGDMRRDLAAQEFFFNTLHAYSMAQKGQMAPSLAAAAG